jgi:membrane protein DedA with SNARE-associated domain
VVEWIQDFISSVGYIGVAVLAFVENFFPPIPSEIVIPFTGYVALQDDRLTLIGMIVAWTIGSVIGALPLYYFGYRLGEERTKRFAERYLKWIGISHEDIDKAHDWLHQHGRLAVFLCRMVPALRSVISIPAGVTHMNLLAFITFTALGTLIWTSVLATAGYMLGEAYEEVGSVLNVVGYVLFTLFIGWLLYRIYQNRRDDTDEDEQEGAPTSA